MSVGTEAMYNMDFDRTLCLACVTVYEQQVKCALTSLPLCVQQSCPTALCTLVYITPQAPPEYSTFLGHFPIQMATTSAVYIRLRSLTNVNKAEAMRSPAIFPNPAGAK